MKRVSFNLYLPVTRKERAAIKRAAQQRGETMSSLLRRAIRKLVRVK